MKNFFAFICVLALGAGIGWFWNEYQNRPCVLQERQIMHKYEFSPGEADTEEPVRRAQLAKMYAELADQGCSENKDGYLKKYREQIDWFYTTGLVFFNGPAGVGAKAEIKVNLKKAADAVNEVAREAAAAMDQFIDKMKNTKVSITVE